MAGPLILCGTVAVCVLLWLASELQPEWRALRGLLRRRGVTGTPHVCGYCKPSASTPAKEHGTPTRETATTAVCSSYSLPGDRWADPDFPQWRVRANNSTVPVSSIYATDGRGASGAQRKPAA